MKERPIIMSGDSVRAILEGHKTQTRRVIRPQPHGGVRRSPFVPSGLEDEHGRELRCPYGVPGDRLWARETWRVMSLPYDDAPEFQFRADMECRGPNVDLYGIMDDEWYWDWFERQNQRLVEDCQGAGLKEHGPDNQYRWTIETCPTRWQPSIHMPKFAARIWLEVVSVRAEQLQEISKDDIVAEGIQPDMVDSGGVQPWGTGIAVPDYHHPFIHLWDSLNAKRGYGWDTNPWVWVAKFSPIAGMEEE